MQNIQHGWGSDKTAATVPAVVYFEEPTGTRKKARYIAVKNTGSVTVQLLVNAADTVDGLANQFSNLTPILLEAGDIFEFPPLDAATGAWYRNLAYATTSGSADILINAI